jgi:ATP-dependent Clp protease ATP-binding subunit ClpA
MGRITTTGIKPTGSFFEIIGRAEEIARIMGSPVAGPEHFFLGMLHADSWPIYLLAERGILDPDEAEAAVMSIISAPGYSPPALLAPAPAPPVARDEVVLMAGKTAAAMGESASSDLHAFLAIIRQRDTVPARALAQVLAANDSNLAAAETAVLEASDETPAVPEAAVILPADQDFDDALQDAISACRAQRGGMIIGSTADEQVWIEVIDDDSRTVVNAALASLGRPTLN